MRKRSATGTARSSLAWLAVVLALSGFAPAAAGDTRTPVAITGTLEVEVEDDFATGRSRRIHLLKEAGTGKMYRLDLAGSFPSRLLSGSTIVARGIAERNVVVLAEGDGVEPLEVIEAAVGPVGERRALVLVLDFQDGTVACSDDEIAGVMFNGEQSIDGLYQETSSGTISFPADTDSDGQPDVARISVDISVTEECDHHAWSDIADAQAQAVGIDLAQYQHKIYVMPYETSCGWAGLASVGCGDFCRVWLRTCQYHDALAHEVGHNLGMVHSATDSDNDGINDCTYCDKSDIMGYAGVGWRQVNGPHKEQMGWLPSEQIVELSPGGPQVHTISPLETHPDFALYPQLLKVFRPDSSDYYYFSYRQRTGYDATLLTDYADQTNIHHYAGAWEKTYFIDALEDDQSFVDESIGLTVTQLSHDSLSATVQLTLGSAASCSGTSGDPDPACSDGVFCNGAEICMAGSCQPGTPVNCDDSVACTTDSCNESADSCDNVTDDTVCDDGLFCNGVESCDPTGGCQPSTAGACAGSLCDESDDQCVECLANADCSDGQFCNGAETCQSGTCQSGQVVDCGDGALCTDDACDENNDTCVNVFDDTNDPSCGPTVCGNGILDSGETCDPPGSNAGLSNECRDDCSFCGDGMVDAGSPGFEVLQDGGLENWLSNGQLDSWRRSIVGGQVLQNNQVTHSGASSVELKGIQSGILRIFQEVQLQPGGSYRLDFRARTKSVTGATPRVKINNMTRLEWLQQDGSWVPTERDALKGGLSQRNAWEFFSIAFDVPASYDPQDVYRIALWHGSTARNFSIFYDEVSLLGPVTGQEQCDDGNNAGGDGCSADCTIEACGNGILDFGEACDPPGSNAGLANECRNDCTFCGDGVVNSGSPGSELLQDSGMENWLGNGQLDSWRRSIVGGEVLQATGVAYSGASSVELRGIQSGILRIFQEVQLHPGGTYRLDFWARTESVTGATPRVKINNMTRLEWLQQDGSWVPSERDALKGGLSQPNAWEPFSIMFVVPESYDPSDVYRIALWNGSTALQFSIFYDDASLHGPLTDAEQCDDGNNVNGDACREDCTFNQGRADLDLDVDDAIQPDFRAKPSIRTARPGRTR